jgi:hypothetical protein
MDISPRVWQVTILAVFTSVKETFVMTVVGPTGHIIKELWKQIHIEGGVS